LKGRDTQRSFFAFLHLFDPHYPYRPPPPYNTRFDPDYLGTMTGSRRDLKKLRKSIKAGDAGANRDAQHAAALYAGEVAHVDEQLKGLWVSLTELGLWENTIVVLSSDHGETFTEHPTEPFDHGFSVYDTEIHIPLIVAGPSLTKGGVVRTPVSNVDIAPTLLELVEIEVPLPFEGKSLGRLLTGQEDESLAFRAHFAESTRPHSNAKPWPNQSLPRAVIQGDLKIQQWPKTKKRWELYNLTTDPGEHENLWRDPAMAQHPRELRRALDSWASHVPIATGAESKDVEVLEQLRALGYIE
jgi:arylsulfatase A-like enzyme